MTQDELVLKIIINRIKERIELAEESLKQYELRMEDNEAFRKLYFLSKGMLHEAQELLDIVNNIQELTQYDKEEVK